MPRSGAPSLKADVPSRQSMLSRFTCVLATVLGKHRAYDGESDRCGPCFYGAPRSRARLSTLGFTQPEAALEMQTWSPSLLPAWHPKARKDAEAAYGKRR